MTVKSFMKSKNLISKSVNSPLIVQQNHIIRDLFFHRRELCCLYLLDGDGVDSWSLQAGLLGLPPLSRRQCLRGSLCFRSVSIILFTLLVSMLSEPIYRDVRISLSWTCQEVWAPAVQRRYTVLLYRKDGTRILSLNTTAFETSWWTKQKVSRSCL